MKNEPSNTELSQQIEALAEAVAAGFAEVQKSFEETNQCLDRIENNHVRRIENLELAAVDLRRDVTKLKDQAGIE